MIDKTKASAWVRGVGQWLGDSPTKAVFVIGVCLFVGYLIGRI